MTPSSFHFRRKRLGFTLIEVLVVVGIIALLVAILIPSLSQARKSARRAACASQLHQIGLALSTYRESYKEFPHQARVGVPNWANNPPTGGNVIGAWPTGVHAALSRFLGRQSGVRPSEVLYCPSLSEADRGSVDIDREQPLGSISNPEPYLHITYFYYGRLNSGDNDPALPRGGDIDINGDGHVDRLDVPSKRRLYVTKEPDLRRVLMADAVSLWAGGQQWRVNHGPDYRRFEGGTIPTPLLDGQNVAFGDAHVVWQRAQQFPVDLRNGINLQQNAMLLQGQDCHWW